MFKKILLAISPSVQTQSAPKAAFDIARRCGAELIIFHSHPLPKDSWINMADLISEEQLVSAIAKRIEEVYADDLKTLPGYSIRVSTRSVAEEVSPLVCKEKVDLIVMGHHTSDERRKKKMWGMVDTHVEGVCNEATCPVMVVTNEASGIAAGVKRIAVATDFSTPSEYALRFAAWLAAECGAKLDIFHVLDVGLCYPNPEYYQQDMEVFVAKAKKKMEQKYAQFLNGLEYEFQAWEGAPFVEVLKFARWNKSDLLVMAHHSSIKDSHRALIGSTVIQVALSPGCPAIIVNYHPKVCR